MNELVAPLWHHPRAPRYYALAGIIGLSLLLVLLESPQINFPANMNFKQLSCKDIRASYTTQAQPEAAQLDLLIPAHVLAQPLLEQLCGEAALQDAYSDIVVHWLPREQLTPETIYQQQFEVMWARDYQLAGLSPDYQLHYQALVALPTYRVLWFARQAIDRELLSTQRIGLLHDTFSRSGYQLPMQALSDLAVAPDSAQLRFYPSRQALVEALNKGEVAVIPDTNYSPLYQQREQYYQAELASNVSAGAWFVSRSVSNDAVLQVLQQRLSQLLESLG
ncbi:hypothetical protein [Agarivorans gilvus]|nr:hypothetical protein [Agarivorans gilvus]